MMHKFYDYDYLIYYNKKHGYNNTFKKYIKKNISATEKTLIIIIKKQKVKKNKCYFITQKPIRKKTIKQNKCRQ